MKFNTLLRLLSIMLIVISFVLAACTATPTAQIEPTQKASPTEGPYPVPTDSGIIVPPYPIEPLPTETIQFQPVTIPEPGPDTGVVFGLLLDQTNDQPITDLPVYLSDIIKLNPGPGFSYGIDQLNSPQTVTNYEGRFAIGDISPGEYALMVWTPFQSTLVIDPSTNIPMVITVKAGESLDLGTLRVQNPVTTDK